MGYSPGVKQGFRKVKTSLLVLLSKPFLGFLMLLPLPFRDSFDITGIPLQSRCYMASLFLNMLRLSRSKEQTVLCRLCWNLPFPIISVIEQTPWKICEHSHTTFAKRYDCKSQRGHMIHWGNYPNQRLPHYTCLSLREWLIRISGWLVLFITAFDYFQGTTIHSFIKSKKYLLSIYCLRGAVLVTEDTVLNKINMPLVSCRSQSTRGHRHWTSKCIRDCLCKTQHFKKGITDSWA